MFSSLIRWQAYLMIGLIGAENTYARDAAVEARGNGAFNRIDNGEHINNSVVREGYDTRNAENDGAVLGEDDSTCQITQQCYSDGNCIPMQVCD